MLAIVAIVVVGVVSPPRATATASSRPRHSARPATGERLALRRKRRRRTSSSSSSSFEGAQIFEQSCVVVAMFDGRRRRDAPATTTTRERMRETATAATRGDAVAAIGALVSASERLAVTECVEGGRRRRDLVRVEVKVGRRRNDGEKGREDRGGYGGGEAVVGARGGRATTSGFGECSAAGEEDGGARVWIRDADYADYDDDFVEDSEGEAEDGTENEVDYWCVALKTARGALNGDVDGVNLDAFDFETSRADAASLSDDGVENVLADVEYSSDGWETGEPTGRDRSLVTSSGVAPMRASGVPANDVFSQIVAEDEDAEDARVDTESEEEDMAGGTQVFYDDEHDDEQGLTHMEAIAGTQEMPDDDVVAATQTVEEEDFETRAEPPRKTPSPLRINAAALRPPGRVQRDGNGDGEDTARPRSLWDAAACTPTEVREAQAKAALDAARPQRIDEPLETTQTQPTAAIGDHEDVRKGDDDDDGGGGVTMDTARRRASERMFIECTPSDAMRPANEEPPALKRPGAQPRDSVVTESAQPLGSIGFDDDADNVIARGVRQTAIDAIRRVRANMREPLGLGLNMSMPQTADEDPEEHVVNDDDQAMENVDDEGGVREEDCSVPSSPDIGLLYSQRPMDEDVASPERPRTQHSQSPFKRTQPPPLASQPEVESPRSRVMMSQHQWRQPRRRAPPPPPRFDDETPSKRFRIIDDDLSQPTQTQPSQEGDFIVELSQFENEGGLVRPRALTSLPAPPTANATTTFVVPPPSEPGGDEAEANRPLPTLGCSKCRFSKGGCGRCRKILEDAKRGIWPKGRGRSKRPASSGAGESTSVASNTRVSKRRSTSQSAKTPSSKTPSRSRGKENTPKPTKKLFASYNFLLTGIGKSGGAVKEAIVSRGGCVLDAPCQTVPTNSVIVVTPTMGRTMKCLYGIASGVKFTTPEWVHRCAEEGEMLECEEPLDADGCHRERHRACSGKLFRGVVVAVTGNDGFVKDFKSLLNHAGAKVELNPQTEDAFDYLIIQSGEKPHSAWIRASRRLGVVRVRHEWLVESILAGELLPVGDFTITDDAAMPTPITGGSFIRRNSSDFASRDDPLRRRKSTRY